MESVMETDAMVAMNMNQSEIIRRLKMEFLRYVFVAMKRDITGKRIDMSFSYFLAWESPQVDGFLWSTLAIAARHNAKLVWVDDTDIGINITFSKELSQTEIMDLLLESMIVTESIIATEDIYTPHDNISNDTSGQAGDI